MTPTLQMRLPAHEIGCAYLAGAVHGGTLPPMHDVARHKGKADPARSILSCVALGCALLWWPAAHAGTMYQCTGSTGEAVYSSSKAGYHHCKAISTYAAPAARRVARPAPVSLTGVTGSVVTTARDLAAGDGMASLAGVRGMVETTARRAALTGVSGSVESTAAARTGDTAHPSEAIASKSARPIASANPVASTSRSVGRTYYYKVVHADGSTYLGDSSPRIQKGDVLTKRFVEYIRTCVACDLHSTIRWGSVSLNLTAYADTIRAASIEYGVDEAFLRAIIHAESAFNPRALSLKGAQGLMQLMPGTASDMGVLDAFNSDQNIRGGARYLGLLLHDFNGNERLAAAAYNAGPGAVQRYKGVPPYAETQVYVERVDTLRKRYGAAIHPPLASRGPG